MRKRVERMELRCGACGSRYELAGHRVRAHEEDALDCHVCRVKLFDWSGTTTWSATLIERGSAAPSPRTGLRTLGSNRRVRAV